jgi:LAO/AO transport system kinase
VGKSTFIESFGKYIISSNRKLAVLTIDPSSHFSKGAILGDKTRMDSLSKEPNAYIRPTASGSTLGGVAQKTRETMLLCEAAGYEVILIETVGVGQSEISVKGMVDFFLLLILSGSGDELQGIKKGIIEMADSIVITKADNENLIRAEQTREKYQNAINILQSHKTDWLPKVMLCSALENSGIKEIWDIINAHNIFFKENGFFDLNRKNQNIAWMHHLIQEALISQFFNNKTIKELIKSEEAKVSLGTKPSLKAARDLLEAYDKNR